MVGWYGYNGKKPGQNLKITQKSKEICQSTEERLVLRPSIIFFAIVVVGVFSLSIDLKMN